MGSIEDKPRRTRRKKMQIEPVVDAPKKQYKALSEIFKDSGAVGEFGLGNLKITIIALDTFEQKLVKNDD